MKAVLFIAFFLAANIDYAQEGYKVIHGYLTTSQTGNEAISGASVEVKSNQYTFRTLTGSEGMFRFDSLPDGTYSVRFTYLNLDLYYPDSIEINSTSNATYFSYPTMNVIHYEYIDCCRMILYRPAQNPTLTYQEIQKSVNKYQLPTLVQGISSNVLRNGNELSLNGARQGDYLFLIDGIKCRELHQVPSATMKSVTVMSHFIPANYGDTTGGVISVETMSYMDLYNERELQKTK